MPCTGKRVQQPRVGLRLNYQGIKVRVVHFRPLILFIPTLHYYPVAQVSQLMGGSNDHAFSMVD
jgi:hypothetical protein